MNLLSQPFPQEQNIKRQLRNAFLSGAFVTLFLLVFNPFGFGEAPVHHLTLFATGYGVITVSIISLLILVEYLFPKWFAEEKWTIGKNILQYILIIFLIGTANFYYTGLVAGMPLEWIHFLNFQFFTLAITIPVVSFMTMLKYFRSLTLYKKEAVITGTEIAKVKHTTHSVITIRPENEKENFSLQLNDLLFIESADNYCKVFHLNNGSLKSTIVRSTLKRLEDQLNFAELFRCHRSFIVQLRNVERVSGNSQGCRLHFKNFDESIPVSRKLNKEIHQRLIELNN